MLSFTRVRLFSLYFMPIGGILPELGQLRNLKWLFLSYNQLTGEDMCPLHEVFKAKYFTTPCRRHHKGAIA